MNRSNAVIPAFLPGTLGGKALADALLGDYRFGAKEQSNVLAFPWPETIKQVQEHFVNDGLFLIDYGFTD